MTQNQEVKIILLVNTIDLIGQYPLIIGQCSPDDGPDVEDAVEAGDDGGP